MSSIKKALIWSLIVNLCAASPPPTFVDDWSPVFEEIFLFNGRIMTFRQLYEPGRPTTNSENIIRNLLQTVLPINRVITPVSVRPDEEIMTSLQLINRHLECLSPDSPSTSSTKYESLQEISLKLLKSSTTDDPIIFIMGEHLEGKTAALKKISQEIRTKSPHFWVLHVDLDELNIHEHLTVLEIIRHSIPAAFQDLFSDLLTSNPKNIIIFIDNIKKLPYYRPAIVSLLQELSKTRVRVIISGDISTKTNFQSQNIELEVYKLSEMTWKDTKQFLTNFVSLEITKALHYTVLNIQELIKNRLDKYMIVFTTLLMETPIPRQPEPLRQLGYRLLSRRHSDLFNYAITHVATLPITLIQRTVINRKEMYDKIVFQLDQVEKKLDYGAVALSQVVHQIEKYPEAILTPFHEEIHRAIIKLKTDDITTIFTNVIDGEIRFIYPDFVNYFAADFLASQLMTLEARYILQKIFSERNYYRILEFLNFDARILDSLALKKILLTGGTMQPVILDNILSQGHGELFDTIINVYLDNNKGDYLRKYFVEPGTNLLSRHFVMQRRFGVLVTHQDFLEFHDRPASDLPNRMDFLGVYSLPGIYEHLWKNEIIAPSIEEKQRLVAFALSNPHLDWFFFHFMEIEGLEYLSNPDRMLYHAIDQSEATSQSVVAYLMEQCRASNVVINQRELLLNVMRWNSPELLDTVMGGLGISLTAETVDETTLAVALDANPSPLYTPTDFWRKMHTLLSRSSVSFDLSSWMQDSEPMSISWTDARSEWFRVMLGAESIDESASSTDAAQIKFTPMDPSDSRFDLYLGRVKTIPSAQWGLKAETLALRRKLLVQKLRQNSWSGSLTELLVHYRSSPLLYSLERAYYWETIKLAVSRDGERLTLAGKNRVLETLTNNLINVEDWTQLQMMVEKNILKFPVQPFETFEGQLIKMINQRLKLSERSVNREEITVSDRLLQSRSQFNPSLQDRNDFVRQKRLLYMKQSSNSALLCLPNRSKRSETIPEFCQISWDDFNDLSTSLKNEKHNYLQISLDSEKFLQSLPAIEMKNREKSWQMLAVVQKIIQHNTNHQQITGNYKMLLENVVEFGSFSGYKKHQRLKNIVTKLSTSLSLKLRINTESVLLNGALGLPIIQQVVKTVSQCNQKIETSIKQCWEAVGSLGINLIPPAIIYSTRYVPLMIRSFAQTALEMLPAAAPGFIRENIYLARSMGLKMIGRFLGPALTGISVILEVANIVEASKTLYDCSRSSSGCVSRQRANSIISIYFSCATLVALGIMLVPGGVYVGAIMLAGLTVLRSLVLSVLDVVDFTRDYNTNFSENMRIIMRSFIGLGPPEDVEALKSRTDWVKSVAESARQALASSHENIVAYGVGLGSIDHINNAVNPSFVFIDMSKSDTRNNYNLSRVLPSSDSNKKLCLPKRDKSQIYEKESHFVEGANFRCENSFVIAHNNRWEKIVNGQSTVVFQLLFANRGVVIGSNTLNNLFLIYEGWDFTLIGSSGNITTDIYTVQSDFFYGRILMNPSARRNILDLSLVGWENLVFFWETRLSLGRVEYDKTRGFQVMMREDMPARFHILGRRNMPDNFSCNWCGNSDCLTHDGEDISVDTGGGQSLKKMDYIVDCKMSVMNPFSVMVGSDTLNAIYTSYLTLGGASAREEVDLSHAKLVKIQPRKSHYSLHFLNYPLLESTIVVTYSPTFKTLSWILQQNVSIQMQISVEPYLVTSPVSDPAEEAENTPTCTFMDSYNNVTVTPVIRIPANETAPLNVTRFDVIGFVNSSRLTDVLAHFANINVSNGKFTVVTRLVDTQTNKTFMMGSRANDNFYIDSTVVFLSGSSGHDVYSWSQQSPRHVWIENSADDDALDTIVIPDQMCDFLTANWSSVKSDCCGTFDDDVTLICEHKTRVNSTQRIILQRYLEAAQYRHLIIYWNDTLYVIIPPAWLHQDKEDQKSIQLGLIFRFSGYGEPVSLILTSQDRFLVLNENQTTNPLTIFRYPNNLNNLNNVIIARKYYHPDSSHVMLENFFEGPSVAIQWIHFQIIIVDDSNINNNSSILLSAHDIEILCSKPAKHGPPTNSSDLLVKYYYFNQDIDEIKNSTTVKIDHDGGQMSSVKEEHLLGILVFTGVQPKEINVSGSDNALVLSAKNKSAHISRWCHSVRYHLYSLEFRIDSFHEPVIVDGLEKIRCRFNTSFPLENIVKKIEKKLKIVQKRYESILITRDSDEFRLMRCVGSIVSQILVNDSLHKLFRFFTYEDQVDFMLFNCPKLFTHDLNQTEFHTIKHNLKNMKRWSYFDPDITENEFKNYQFFYLKFKSLKNCWKSLKNSLIPQIDSPINYFQQNYLINQSISECIKI